ncbi:hypothetical protein [Actinomyces dentalis]|uniref:hypothetical protein n=1 Tax=Actinomyces dentalis TaxID=272548 RepID=UPI0023529F34|nr:hypothetical protein [Actinomyces dentalis]
MTWHHAYNGIPAIREPCDGNGPNSALYKDDVSSGHDHLAAGRLSGELAVKIVAASPTIPGQQTADGRVVVASRSGDPKGARTWEDATIPVTTLKGILSSAYEAVTASRMRVLGPHDHVLTHRRTTQEATVLYPVLLMPDEEGASLRARVMLGRNKTPRNAREWLKPAYVCAAVLPNSLTSATAIFSAEGKWLYSGAHNSKKRDKRRKGSDKAAEARLEELRRVAPHLKQISFSAQSEKFYDSKRFIVKDICGERFCGTRGRPIETLDRADGVVVRLTPPGAGPLIDTKYNEFIFFDVNPHPTYRTVSEEVLSGLVEVVHSYVENIRALKRREDRREAAGLPRIDPGSDTRTLNAPNTWLVDTIINGDKAPGLGADRDAIRAHLIELASSDPGLPLFASIDNGKITGLTPSQVGRRTGVQALSPAQLAEAAEVAPAHSHKQASAADRMWGFVADEKEEDADQAAAVRGRITIRPVTPAALPTGQQGWLRLPKGDAKGWILPTLASPKPSTGAPYLRAKTGAALDEALTRAQTFQPDQVLIRKVYPTHRALLPARNDNLPRATRLSGEKGPGDTAVGSYLAPGAVFHTTIAFEGLTAEELAVLVWLLTPRRLVPRSGKRRKASRSAVGYHRLGFGKPLGLGAVEIRATDVVVRDGAGLADGYQDLTGCLGCPPPKSDRDTPEQRLGKILSRLPRGFNQRLLVRAFVRAAYGWGGDVGYPAAGKRAGGDELSPIITWFKNREENRVKHRIGPRKNSLDSRYDFPPLAEP